PAHSGPSAVGCGTPVTGSAIPRAPGTLPTDLRGVTEIGRKGPVGPLPSASVHLARFVSDDVPDPAAVHAPGGRTAAAGTAAARQAGVRIPGRQGDREGHRRSA